GKDVTPDQTLSFIVANIEPGRRINLDIVRDGQRRTLPVVVGRRPSEESLAAQLFNPDDPAPQSQPTQGGVIEQSLGVAVMALTPPIAGQLGLPSGTTGVVVTEVDPNADAATKGLARGAVILEVNNRNVTGVEDLEAAIQAAKSENRSAILLRVRLRGAPRSEEH